MSEPIIQPKNSSYPIGPQHPALKEPESFLIHLEGEKTPKRASSAWGTNIAASRKPAEERTITTSRTST